MRLPVIIIVVISSGSSLREIPGIIGPRQRGPVAGSRRAGRGVDTVHAPADDLGNELRHLELEVELHGVCHWCELDVARGKVH